jgi:fatty acid synthase
LLVLLCVRVHNASINFNIASVLPSGEQSFPVPRGTPMISPLVKWDHSLSWDVPSFDKFMVSGGNACASVFKVALGPDSKDQHLAGHVIDGRVLFPATGYLTLAWRALAKQKGILQDELHVTFTDCCIHRATILPPAGISNQSVTCYMFAGQSAVAFN